MNEHMHYQSDPEKKLRYQIKIRRNRIDKYALAISKEEVEISKLKEELELLERGA